MRKSPARGRPGGNRRPHNVGAIFRSAAALGMDAILVTPTCCDPLHRRSVRVSMGTVFQIPWTYIGSKAADWPATGWSGCTPSAFGPPPWR